MLWVNNAGVLYTGDVWEHEDEVIRQMTDVNVLGMFWGARAAVDAMRAEGGHLINIASLSAVTPVPGLAVYGATKQAVLGFSISLAGDLDRAGVPIHVSAVCPHAINTDMVKNKKKFSAVCPISGKPLSVDDFEFVHCLFLSLVHGLLMQPLALAESGGAKDKQNRRKILCL